jgi:hypothetical protein
MGNRIKVHLAPGFDQSLVPIPAVRHRDWWENTQATKDHARHCLPLAMANSLGYYIRSPGTFRVRWNGDHNTRASIKPLEVSSHYEVDNHATFGGFTIQAKFIPVTDDPGDFIYIKGIPNEQSTLFVCMEAVIEAWWNVGHFGIVYQLNQRCDFTIYMGQPVAQMFLYRGDAGAAEIQLMDGYPEGHAHWLAKRRRPGYTKDLDYFKGKNSAEEEIPTHISTWKEAGKFR